MTKRPDHSDRANLLDRAMGARFTGRLGLRVRAAPSRRWGH
jgi:hypothetical protein